VLAADHPEAGIDIDTPQQLAEQQALIQTRTQSDPYPR
jgi:hypothetical protein